MNASERPASESPRPSSIRSLSPARTPPPPPEPPAQRSPVALRSELPRDVRAASAHVVRSRAYAFVLDRRGLPIELGSGRFAKAYLGEERWRERKSVDRPADIYSLGAMFYYLISGAYANPKTLYDAFHAFIEYEVPDETSTIEAYLQHEYGIIASLRAPGPAHGTVAVAPADRFFTYKHYLDGSGDLIAQPVMKIIARCMIRNKPDSYCQAEDVETKGISRLMEDLIALYGMYDFHPAPGSSPMARRGLLASRASRMHRRLERMGHRLRWMWRSLVHLWWRRRRR